MRYRLVAQGNELSPTLSKALREETRSPDFDRLDVAVAYATLQGVRAFEQAIGGGKPTSRWVVGLDDAVTQPEALEYLSALPGASVRVAEMSPQRRFHPKVYRVWSSSKKDICVSAIGSGNMTLNGLRKNGEAAVLLISDSDEDSDSLYEHWNEFWNQGKDVTKEIIDKYKKKYAFSKKQRKKISDAGLSPEEPDAEAPVEEESDYDGNPASARVAWLDAGSAPAGGRDLEFPRDMVPFFRLRKSPSERVLETANGSRFALKFTERRDNGMWRLLLSSDAIRAAVGRENLRPIAGGNRSDLAVVFARTGAGADYALSIIPIGGNEYAAVVARSRAVKGLFKTRGAGGRNFGFF